MYGCLFLVTLLALVITFSKIKVVELIQGTPDPDISTFAPVKQRTASKIMYTGNGFMPVDWHFFHSGVCSNYKAEMSYSCKKLVTDLLDTH